MPIEGIIMPKDCLVTFGDKIIHTADNKDKIFLNQSNEIVKIETYFQLFGVGSSSNF